MTLGEDTMQYPSTTIKIHAAAFYFVNTSRDLHEIANAFGVTEYAVRKWAKTPQWEKALDVFGYTGDRYFITKPDTRYRPRCWRNL